MIFQGGFEINLDHRKLRTPQAKLFTVPSEALAIAVATEWDSQQDTIKFYTMHLVTSSCTYTPTAGFLGYLAKMDMLFQIRIRPLGQATLAPLSMLTVPLLAPPAAVPCSEHCAGWPVPPLASGQVGPPRPRRRC